MLKWKSHEGEPISFTRLVNQHILLISNSFNASLYTLNNSLFYM